MKLSKYFGTLAEAREHEEMAKDYCYFDVSVTCVEGNGDKPWMVSYYA